MSEDVLKDELPIKHLAAEMWQMEFLLATSFQLLADCADAGQPRAQTLPTLFLLSGAS